jgi:hypothetical protein
MCMQYEALGPTQPSHGTIQGIQAKQISLSIRYNTFCSTRSQMSSQIFSLVPLTGYPFGLHLISMICGHFHIGMYH